MFFEKLEAYTDEWLKQYTSNEGDVYNLFLKFFCSEVEMNILTTGMNKFDI